VPVTKPRSARDRLREAREAAYCEAIVEAAERLFGDRGIDGTKMDDVAGEAGMSIATLYTVFRGKAEVVNAVHRTRLATLTAPSVQAAAESGPADVRLRDTLRQGIALQLEHPHYVRMHLREGFSWGLPSAIAAHTPAATQFFAEGVEGALAEIIAEGVSQGVFETDSAGRSARAVVMLQQLHLADWIDGGERDSADAVFTRYWADVERLLMKRG
jgi:AcrR family transcriptional regulator